MFRGLFTDPLRLFANVAIIFLILPIHEYAHGYVAYKLGDHTAKNMGRLTLNPLAHIDPIGAISMVFLGYGWAKAVPVNSFYFGNPKKGMAITAAAGPIANILLSLAFLILYKLLALVGLQTGLIQLGIYEGFVTIFYYIAYISTSLAVFNLIPIPPLDGSKIIALFLPNHLYYKLMEYERIIGIAVMFLSWTGILSLPIGFLSEGIMFVLNKLTFFIPV